MRYLQRGLTHHDTARATPGFTLYTPLLNATWPTPNVVLKPRIFRINAGFDW